MDQSYEKDGGVALQGWTKLKDIKISKEAEAVGYYGVAYRNDSTGEVVTANRGTEPMSPADWRTNKNDIAQGNFTDKTGTYYAMEFAKQVKAYVDKNYSGAKITALGHSMGGFEA
jgi:hypothetical protein